MRLTRVHVEEPLVAGQPCVIEGTGANHIMRVLRLRDGELLTLFDGRGGEYGARITGFKRNSVQVDVQEHRDVERESTLDLTLAQGISRGERMDWVIQKATELGVRRIIPVLTERSVVRLDERQSERKLQHWRAIVISACEQCGRNTLPQLLEPLEMYGMFQAIEPDFLRVLLSPSGTLRAGDLGQPAKIAVLIGPEGGLAEREQEAAVSAGFKEVQLGLRILRTETAAIAALAALQHRYGDL